MAGDRWWRHGVDVRSYYRDDPDWRDMLGYVVWTVVLTLILAVFFLTKAYAGESVTLKASWYSRESLVREGTWKHGETMMANGRRFQDENLTCAARLWPLGTTLRVRNIANNKTVEVKVTDRIGKRFATTRVDLSKGAFSKISDLKLGVIPVEVEVLS